MNKKLSVLALLMALGSVTSTTVASPSQGLSKIELDEINASCKEEAQDAENAQWYTEECVAERIQALKEEKGLAQPEEKEES